MQFSGKGIGVKQNQIFLERFATSDDIAFAIENKAGSVKDQAIISANLIYECNRHVIISRDGGQHVMPQLALVRPERRCRNVEHKISAGMYECLDRIHGIETARPEMLVVPGVLTDGQGHLLSTKWKQYLAACRRKITHLVEDIVSRQQHFRLNKFNPAIHEQRGGIHN